jgi:hypothetical protein
MISLTVDVTSPTLLPVIGPSAKPIRDRHSQSNMTTPIGRGFLRRTKKEINYYCPSTNADFPKHRPWKSTGRCSFRNGRFWSEARPHKGFDPPSGSLPVRKMSYLCVPVAGGVVPP